MEGLEYRQADYFNDWDTYVFETLPNYFKESKVYFDKGYWWTVEKPELKATTAPCKVVVNPLQ